MSIVGHIESECAPLNAAITRTDREIFLLRGYRTTLTADVVMGKLDVREVVKRLPDEVEESLPADDLADDTEDEAAEESDA